MDQESIVYGCIKDTSHGSLHSDLERRQINRRAMLALPQADAWPFLCQEMFKIPLAITSNSSSANHSPNGSFQRAGQNSYQTEVMPFGASYRAVEYEWSEWLAKFEGLLAAMYWSSAVVHLETELSGVHTFLWEATKGCHEPHSGEMRVRCEWVREQGLAC